VDLREIRNRNFWTDEKIPLIMEYGIYLFVLLMFAGRFGTFREIGFYVPPVLWLLRCFLRKDFDLEWKEPLFVCLLILSASAIASSLSAKNPMSSLYFFKKDYLKIILLYVVISTAFSDDAKLRKLSLFLAVTGIVYLFAGTFKIVTDLLHEGLMEYGKTRYYATIFLFFLPFLILQSVTTEDYKKVLWKISIAWSVAGLFLIGVRGSWLGLGGIFIFWIIFLRDKVRKKISILKWIIPAIAVAATIIIVFLFFPDQYKLIKGHVPQKLQVSLRFEAWKIYLKMSEERPLFGHGLDDMAMSEHYRKFYESLKGAFLPEDKPGTPHNQFIKILYQQGIVGLTAYVVLFFVLIYRIVKRIYMNRICNFSFIGVAILSVAIGEYIIRCLSEDRSLVPLGILLGMAGAFLKEEK
jgi:O-antigen ligase